MPNETEEQKEKLLQLVRACLDNDKELREKYQIGDKFRFIRERLTQLVAHVEEGLKALEKETKKMGGPLSEDDMVVYVYLYNAQGLALTTWQKMLNPSVFYEYSVNRPIYTDKSHVEGFIRSRANKVQHGYLAVVIRKQDVLKGPEVDALKDAIGNPVIKVKEGSLSFDKMLTFTHNGIDYTVKENGELEKKQV
jgi:intracellular multiplication protein IcmQ